MKIDAKVTIEVERDCGLRCHEYVVISHDRDGREVQGFQFYVSDTGRILRIIPPIDLSAEEEVNG